MVAKKDWIFKEYLPHTFLKHVGLLICIHMTNQTIRLGIGLPAVCVVTFPLEQIFDKIQMRVCSILL